MSFSVASGELPRGDAGPWPPGAKIKLLVPSNPHGGNNASAKSKRWALVWKHGGKSWETFREAGGNSETLRNVVKQKLAEVR